MGCEEVARVCADSAETIHAIASEFGTAPPTGLGADIDTTGAPQPCRDVHAS
ncbi:hypothetical protein MABM_52100 (plasmid) [Mycobacteroides abscessus]|uniref:hypothetical protein n=1 Tax=Mycobacteroides abscessus TaxID=36809 RepID=UPI00039AB995|nr:hypothetical protein [Mycobacteroides abscessus]BBZ85294.1 hypothetical protein MABM_52100 [Mycobacteroides abscessus]